MLRKLLSDLLPLRGDGNTFSSSLTSLTCSAFLPTSPSGDGNYRYVRTVSICSWYSFSPYFPSRGWKQTPAPIKGTVLEAFLPTSPSRGWKPYSTSKQSVIWWALSDLIPLRGYGNAGEQRYLPPQETTRHHLPKQAGPPGGE